MTLSFPLTLTDRFAWIMRELHAAVAARIKFPPVTGAMILFICARLRKFVVEFEALAARIRAGTYAPQPGGRRRVARGTGRKRQSPILAHYEMGLPPWQPGWLHRIAPNTAGVWASALRDLFSDPEMAALIASVPRLRRILRPLCFMLALEATLLRPAAPAPATVTAEHNNEHREPAGNIFLACEPITEAIGPPIAARCGTEAAGEIFRAA